MKGGGRGVDRVAYMPRRGAKDAAFVLAAAAARGALEGYEVTPIAGLDEDAVAPCLRDSLVFLSLGYHEGCLLPPAEAMASGAIVVGYDGFGGAEYFLPELVFRVPTGDLIGFAETLEHVLRLEADEPAALRARAAKAAAYIAETYSPEQEEEYLLAAWNDVIRSLAGS